MDPIYFLILNISYLMMLYNTLNENKFDLFGYSQQINRNKVLLTT